MHAVVAVRPLEKYTLEVVFDDGKVKRVDIAPFLTGEVFEPLKREEMFRSVSVDRELGAIVWPNGADFCPDFLYRLDQEKAAARRKRD
jgi:hypothetical protein